MFFKSVFVVLFTFAILSCSNHKEHLNFWDDPAIFGPIEPHPEPKKEDRPAVENMLKGLNI